MPKMLTVLSDEMIFATNPSFMLYPLLSVGAGMALNSYGSQQQKETYLPKIYSGEWSGTMCLTEPHAGTDLGIIKTKLNPMLMVATTSRVPRFSLQVATTISRKTSFTLFWPKPQMHLRVHAGFHCLLCRNIWSIKMDLWASVIMLRQVLSNIKWALKRQPPVS